MDKRGQLAIFVIVAILIVGVILAVILVPKLDIIGSEVFTPTGFLKNCIEPELRKGIDVLSNQGGYFNPEGFIIFNDSKVKYLCYNAENYRPCLVQEPVLKTHFEDELENYIAPVVKTCVSNLEKEYRRQGFTVTTGSVGQELSIIPGKINLKVNAPSTVTKETSNKFDSFDISLDSKIYDLLLTATSIVEFEAALGDSETSLYIRYYPDLSINKVQLADGSTIYILSNIVSKEKFIFASRSLVWPPGYGLE